MKNHIYIYIYIYIISTNSLKIKKTGQIKRVFKIHKLSLIKFHCVVKVIINHVVFGK